MTTLEPEQKDILEKLNEIALEANWGTVDRVNSVPKAVAVIQEAVEEIKRLRKEVYHYIGLFDLPDFEAEREVRKHTAEEILQRLARSYKGIAPLENVFKVIAAEYSVTLD